MTNDTSKLDGALMELGDTMADNLVAMGVSGASASDGLTTLANNILNIAPSVGGITPTVSIDLSKSPTLICRGATVDIMALVHADYDDTSQTDVDLKGYLQGATVTFKNGNNSIGYAVSDNDGIATLTINDIAMGNYSIVGSFDGTGTDYESATSSAMTFTVNDYPTITLSADKTTVNVGETVTFTITAEYNNTPVVGYPIQLYKDGSSMGSLYAGLTNNNGECVISYIIPNNATNMTINANTLSNDINLTVTNYLFIDDCTTNRLSEYTITNNSFSYDSTTPAYNGAAPNQGMNYAQLPNISLPTNFKFSCKVKTGSGANIQPGLRINEYIFRAILSINKIGITDASTMFSRDFIESDASISKNTWYYLEFIYNNGVLTGNFYDENKSLLSTVSYTASFTPTTLYLVAGWYNDTHKYTNITVEPI